MKEVLDEIIAVMQQTYGKEIFIYDENFLLKSLERRRQITGSGSEVAYLKYLAKSSIEAEILYDSLRITFSQFFRDPLTFAILKQRILPSLIRQKKDGREIRIWSAACAAGQETYSIAMLLYELGLQENKKIPYRIFATDISQEALDFAKAGKYTREAMQNIQLQQIDNCFVKRAETYTIIDKIKENIRFSAYDLLDSTSTNPPESIYGDFDLIFCCNVLFYYKPKSRRVIINKMKNSLANMGYLVTSETESALVEAETKYKLFTSIAPVFSKQKNEWA